MDEITEKIETEMGYLKRYMYNCDFKYCKEFITNINNFSYTFSQSGDKSDINIAFLFTRNTENSQKYCEAAFYIKKKLEAVSKELSEDKFILFLLNLTGFISKFGKEGLINYINTLD